MWRGTGGLVLQAVREGGERATSPGVVSDDLWECFTLKIHQIHKDHSLAPPQKAGVVEDFFMSPWKKHKIRSGVELLHKIQGRSVCSKYWIIYKKLVKAV